MAIQEFDISDEIFAEVAKFKASLDLTDQQVVEYALFLLTWMLGAVADGQTIAEIDETSDTYAVLKNPLLDQVARMYTPGEPTNKLVH